MSYLTNCDPIFLDYAAGTPVDPKVAKKMMGYLMLNDTFANPSSISHRFGWRSAKAIEDARKELADLINCDSSEIIWTSGATESNNLAIKGLAISRQAQGNHIITSETEHKSVLNTCQFLEEQGFEVTYLTPESDGILDLEKIDQACRADTILISIMHVNNEIGVIQEIDKIGAIAKKHGIAFHVDAAQGLGKLAINLADLPIDLMSFSAHKIYGPKGVGALYIREKSNLDLSPQMHGGGQERGLRPGTLATHQIVGMGEACAIAKHEMKKDIAHITALSDRFLEGIKNKIAKLNTPVHQSYRGIINVSFNYTGDDPLIIDIEDHMAVSSHSACNSSQAAVSYVLLSLGLKDSVMKNTLRISIGRFSTEKDIDSAIKSIQEVVC